MRERTCSVGLIWVLLAPGCGVFDRGPSGSPPDAQADDPSCQIQAAQEHAPGWPYDLPTFRDQVLPLLLTTCGAAGCHQAPSGNGGFVVWLDAAPGNCSYAKTFNSFAGKTDLANPPNSPAYVAMTGGDPQHPFRVDKADAKAQLVLQFVTQAGQTQAQAGGGTTAPPPSASPFDYGVFQAQIQPILDGAEGRGCTASLCHAAGAGGFQLTRQPAAGSPEMLANFNAVTARCDLGNPAQSQFLLQATTRHDAGASAVVSTPEASTILAWLQQAQRNAPPGGGGAAGCPSIDNFNLGVFRDQILPILTGRVDLNHAGAPSVTTGCARTTCHGADRTGGALVIKADADPATVLTNFACFVNLANPSASEILLCPLNLPGCRRSPHPGQNVFAAGTDDRNFQRILSYLYAAKTVASPLDFAFYVRQIDTVFNDVNAVEAGAQNRTCADTISCHGVVVAGQPPPNGSDFAIIANASDKTRLLANFASAANFTNFIDPLGSSLFLYPTNQIADARNPFATGLPHPGGPDFAVDSPQALAILRWAHGLRPDEQGFVDTFLGAGDFPAAAITDLTALDESVQPSIFDLAGGAQNGGLWDLLDQSADLSPAFPRAGIAGRVVYAAAYLLNVTASDIPVEITLTSPDAVKLWIGDQPVLQANDASLGQTALANLPSYRSGHVSTRVLVKLFQPDDRPLGFTLQLADTFGNPLTESSGEIVVTHNPQGGI
jgi:hypothetical protein